MISEHVNNKNPPTTNGNNDTPFHLAARNGYLQLCQLIIGTIHKLCCQKMLFLKATQNNTFFTNFPCGILIFSYRYNIGSTYTNNILVLISISNFYKQNYTIK